MDVTQKIGSLHIEDYGGFGVHLHFISWEEKLTVWDLGELCFATSRMSPLQSSKGTLSFSISWIGLLSNTSLTLWYPCAFRLWMKVGLMSSLWRGRACNKKVEDWSISPVKQVGQAHVCCSPNLVWMVSTWHCQFKAINHRTWTLSFNELVFLDCEGMSSFLTVGQLTLALCFYLPITTLLTCSCVWHKMRLDSHDLNSSYWDRKKMNFTKLLGREAGCSSTFL